ncbi:MAG: GGDEF domain-containing protein [Spirochaetales bacterium]|nr:GGDEF domain-containing protein [Spirochaetales bacterium]
MDTLLRIELDLYSLLLIGAMTLSLAVRSVRSGTQSFRYFSLIAISLSLVLINDMLAWLLDGQPGTAARLALHVFNTLYYTLHIIPVMIFLLYIDHITRQGSYMGGGPLHALAFVVLVLFAIAALTSPWTDALYWLDSTNHYVRGRMFTLLIGASLFIGLVPEVILFIRRRNLPRHTFILLAAYPIPILAGASLQYFHQGSAMLWPAATVALMLVYLTMQQRFNDIDPVTLVYRRSMLMERLASHRLYRERNIGSDGKGTGCWAIAFDIVGFRNINQIYGMSTGDAVLHAVAHAMKSALGTHDIAIRLGNDEFVALVFDTDHRRAETVRDSIGQAVRTLPVPGLQMELGIRLVMSYYDTATYPSPEAFLAHLESLLYTRERRQ